MPLQLNYREFGSGEPKLLILHGLLGSSQNWNSPARKLSRSYHVVVPDLRNHGASPHGRHSLELLSDDVLGLIEQLGWDRVFLLGHSMGGLAAMLTSFKHPQRLQGLIVVDIAPIAQLSDMEPIFEALEEIDLSRVTLRDDADRMLRARIENPAVRQFLLQNLEHQEDGSYAWRSNLPELHRFVSGEGFQAGSLDKFEGPTLFIGGSRSEQRLADHEEVMLRHFPGSQLLMIPNAGHWVHFEAMDEFVEGVVSFVGRRT